MCGRYSLALRPSQIRVNFEGADPPLHVWDAPPDEGDGAPRQSYNFAPGYNGLVFRAEVPDYGAGPAPVALKSKGMDNGSKSASKKRKAADIEDEDEEQDAEKDGEKESNTEPNDEAGEVDDTTTEEPATEKEPKETHYVLSTMKWGLIPHWTKRNPDYRSMLKTINCRSDSLARPGGMWASMKGRKRCIIVTQGFYEWHKPSPREKIPYFTKRKDGQMMLMAGLWDCVSFDDGEKVYSYTIITTDANKQLSWLHDRMPVILDNGSEEMWRWLDPKRHVWSSDIQNVLKPYEGELECYAVAKEVGKVGNNDPSFIVPVASKENKNNIANFFGGGGKKQAKDEEVVTKTEVKESGVVKTEIKSEDEDEDEDEEVKSASPASSKPQIKKEEQDDDAEDKKEIETKAESPNEETNAPAPVAKKEEGSESPKKSLKREYDEEEEPEDAAKPAAKVAKTETSSSGGRKTRSATQNDRGVFAPEKKKRATKSPERGSQKITGFFTKK